MRKTFTALAALTAALAGPAAAQEYIPVGNLVDFTGRTAVVGKEYGQAKIDAMNWINENGGINGKLLDFDTVDYSYIVPRALATYKKWKSRYNVVAIQGWGTGDTEALISFVAKDQIPVFLGFLFGPSDRPDRRQPEHQEAGALQLLLRAQLFRRRARADPVGGGRRQGEGHRQPEIRAYGRQPSLSERAEGVLRGIRPRAGHGSAAGDPVFAGAGRLQGAVPQPQGVGRATMRSWPTPRARTSRC